MRIILLEDDPSVGDGIQLQDPVLLRLIVRGGHEIAEHWRTTLS